MPIKYPKIGAHISAAGDVSQAPLRAASAGCECFQFFSRPPQGGPAKPITEELATIFKANCKKDDLESYIHTPYYINLASAKNNIYFGSIKVIREELERGSLLGVKYVMAHMGSSKELGEKEGLKKAIEGLKQVMKGYKGSTELLLEISAGAGAIIGDTFEELGAMIHSVKLKKYKIGICFDTAHAFASGYDLRTSKAVSATFKQFDKVIGKEKLKLIHANDSLAEFDSKKDRHAHIGEGKIGLEGFKAIVAYAKKLKINLILETPHDGHEDQALLKDIKTLKNLR